MGWPCKPDAIWVLRRQVEYPRAGFFYRPWCFRKMQWKVDQEIEELLRSSPSPELRDFLLAAATGQEVPLMQSRIPTWHERFRQRFHPLVNDDMEVEDAANEEEDDADEEMDDDAEEEDDADEEDDDAAR